MKWRAYTEWSKSEKDKYCILTHTHTHMYMESRKTGSNRDANIKNRLVDTVGEGEGETDRVALKHMYQHM